MHDRARIYVEGGRGGEGCVSFRREANVAKGGPDGGDGGRGGDVVLVCDPSRRDLAAVRHARHFRADRGRNGQGNRRHGARGEDRTLLVPPGTQVEGLGGERFDLTRPGQRALVAGGGSGGHGNKRFAGPTRQAPRFAERGLEGESGWIELRLKLLADAGLIGLPNAGKSSLLRRLTRASPKVAAYPFTTLEPALGTLESEDRQLVLADIPGLIEGAAQGAGLGQEFLAHVERCRVLVHLVEIAPGWASREHDAAGGRSASAGAETEAEGGAETEAEGGEDPIRAYETVRRELTAFGAGLDLLPELVVLSKRDLLSAERCEEALAAWRERLGDGVLGVIAVSSATGEGLEELRAAILAAVPEHEAAAIEVAEGASTLTREPALGAPPSAGESVFEAEHRVYRPAAEQGFSVERIEDGVFAVEGRGVEVLVRRHDLANPEALAYLEQRLHEIGVVSALEAAGFEPGDEVRIGEEAFELEPG